MFDWLSDAEPVVLGTYNGCFFETDFIFMEKGCLPKVFLLATSSFSTISVENNFFKSQRETAW